MSSTRESMVHLHAAIIGERQNVVIPRLYLEATGWDYVAAVVLRELVTYTSWSLQHKPRRQGWFYRTEDDWQEAVHLSSKTVNRCIKSINDLAGAELVEKKVRKIRTDAGTLLSTTATHYRINEEAFEQFFGTANGRSRNFPMGDSGNGPNGSSGNFPEGDSLTLTELTDRTDRQEIPATKAAGEPETSIVEEKPELFNGRTHAQMMEIADHHCRGLGIALKDLHGTNRFWTIVNAAKKVPARFTKEQVERCTRYMASDTFQREAGSGVTLTKVTNKLPEWVAMGEPEAIAHTVAKARRWKENHGKSLSIEELQQMTEQLEARERGQ